MLRRTKITAIAGIAAALGLGLGACGSSGGGLNAKPLGPMTPSLLQAAYPSLTSCTEQAATSFTCSYTAQNGRVATAQVTLNPGGGVSAQLTWLVYDVPGGSQVAGGTVTLNH
jgi:hypothetical protein